MKKKKTKKRSRGGASYPCPRCRGPSRVRETRRNGDVVMRQRVCVKKSCGERFLTEEEVAPLLNEEDET